jgi:hypothetical protein
MFPVESGGTKEAVFVAVEEERKAAIASRR